jgi:pSer/pThr/pTyr-binding forkhead associated (FHA) protein
VYRLTIRLEGLPDEHHVDLARDVALVGRRPGVDVPLPHADVGGVHLRLERTGSAVTVIDGASMSGTAVNGEPLPPGGRRLLVSGDQIRVAGRFHLAYLARSPASTPTGNASTGAMARAMVAGVLGSLPAGRDTTPWLEIVAGPSGLRRVHLPAPGQPLVIGRGESCDLRLSDDGLSREHLRISRSLTGASVVELGSKNGTRLRRRPLAVGQEQPLLDGDELRLGACVLVYRDPTDAYLQELEATEPDVVRPRRRPWWILGLLLMLGGLAYELLR